VEDLHDAVLAAVIESAQRRRGRLVREEVLRCTPCERLESWITRDLARLPKTPLMYAQDPDAALDVLDVVIDEGRRTAARLGAGFGVLVVARRDADPSEAVDLAHLAARRSGNGVVSFGLAGDEARYAPGPFAEAFAIARDAGLIPRPARRGTRRPGRRTRRR
jgi:adenosine deaminase